MLVPVLPAFAETVQPEGAAGLIASLRSRILAGHSATAVLEAWCAERGLAADPHLVARRVPGLDKPPSAAQRARLDIGPDEPVRYRRVRLSCGEHVLSEADNWYVPARLTPAMNAALDTTEAPFGRVVRPLAPARRNLALRPLERSGDGPPGPADPLFEVDAVLSTGEGLPFCEVAETYLGAVLGRGPR
ncbi:cytochrome P450 [Methylobacterium trifolii]|uniref:cytochrome P450 n=1 Tax=Methylobacterium trifolii TaxID=1003092 RepID=UPI001EE1359C|nr:cytochrome P450 [Methylobacterium trifolii]